jgi:hypothetical protein
LNKYRINSSSSSSLLLLLLLSRWDDSRRNSPRWTATSMATIKPLARKEHNRCMTYDVTVLGDGSSRSDEEDVDKRDEKDAKRRRRFRGGGCDGGEEEEEEVVACSSGPSTPLALLQVPRTVPSESSSSISTSTSSSTPWMRCRFREADSFSIRCGKDCERWR